MSTLAEIVDSATSDLRTWAGENPDDTDASDVIHEIADGAVPVYTGDLMKLAADNISLATAEPAIDLAFDGSPTPANIVAANVYEYVTGRLWETWTVIEAERQDAEDECALCGEPVDYDVDGWMEADGGGYICAECVREDEEDHARLDALEAEAAEQDEEDHARLDALGSVAPPEQDEDPRMVVAREFLAELGKRIDWKDVDPQLETARTSWLIGWIQDALDDVRIMYVLVKPDDVKEAEPDTIPTYWDTIERVRAERIEQLGTHTQQEDTTLLNALNRWLKERGLVVRQEHA